MTIRKFLLEPLTILFLAILPATSFGQSQGPSEQFYPSVSPEVAVVDYQSLYLRSQFGIRVASEYQEAQLSLRAEGNYYSELFEDEERELAEKKDNLTSSEFELLVEDFDSRVESRRLVQDGKGIALSEWENRQQEIFQAYVTTIIVQVAQFFGSKLVIQRDLTVWTDESLDITPYVLAQVNATIGDGTGLSDYSNPLEFAGIAE
ncbi:MAG: OmpH family outer membrane protein [Rhodobacteraceae bacterium]|nr:OmpH family outer membrane protein [Paracoccaceae bacterium]MCY4251121.1 OmpH family outer membrane protein [Paracoccaceae bacterium]